MAMQKIFLSNLEISLNLKTVIPQFDFKIVHQIYSHVSRSDVEYFKLGNNFAFQSYIDISSNSLQFLT